MPGRYVTLLERLRFKIATVAFMLSQFVTSPVAAERFYGPGGTTLPPPNQIPAAFGNFILDLLAWPTYDTMGDILGLGGPGKALLFISVVLLTYFLIHKFVVRINSLLASRTGSRPLDRSDRLDKTIFYLVTVSAWLYLVVALNFHIWVLGGGIPLIIAFVIGGVAYAFKGLIATLIWSSGQVGQSGGLLAGSIGGWLTSGYTGSIGNAAMSRLTDAASKNFGWFSGSIINDTWDYYQRAPRCDSEGHLNIHLADVSNPSSTSHKCFICKDGNFR